MNCFKTLPLIGLAIAAMVSSNALAADASTTFQASSSVPASCSIQASRPVTFRTAYNPVTTHATAENNSQSGFGTVGVTCNRQASLVSVRLNEGLTPSSGSTCAVPLRNMVSPNGDRLPYTLWVGYGPSATADQWGCAESNQKTMSFQDVTFVSTAIAGKIPPGLNVQGGSYADTVTATVIF